MSHFISKVSSENYEVKFRPNFTNKTFTVQVPAMGFNNWQICKTIKLEENQFNQFLNFDGDKWIELFFNIELRREFLTFTDKELKTRKTRVERIIERYEKAVKNNW